MATFRPNRAERVCELNFDDKFIYTLPLHEDTLRKIAKIGDKQIEALKTLKGDDLETLDKAYNLSLDALDEILGEGAGADVMSIYENPGLFDIAEVVKYIGEEYQAAYKEYLGVEKANGLNREARRGRR